MAAFELYTPPANTVAIAIPQPRRATWEATVLGTFADGSARVGRYVTVTWQFRPMSPADYTVFIQNRPASGAMQFKTFRQAVGSTAGAWVKCAGIMQPIMSGVLQDSMYYGVAIRWQRVVTV